MKLQYIFIILLLTTVIALTSCGNPSHEDIFTITSEGSFDAANCEAKGLTGKAIMLESKYCGHCQDTLPIFAKACDDAGVKCEILDIAESEQYEKMISYDIEVQFTPTFIIGCEYFIGVKDKEGYLSYLENMN